MSDNCPVDIGVARNGEYWKRVGPRERQAAYQDWLLRERQRAALAGAACMTCVLWCGRPGDAAAACGHSTSARHVEMDGIGAVCVRGWRNADSMCEHYLPRAEHDPRPEGGTP